MTTTPSSQPTTKTARLRCLPNGTIQALSSNGRTVYAVTPTSCTCPAGQNGRRCYHVATAARRYLVCQRCGRATAEVEEYVTFDGIVTQCRDLTACESGQATASDLYAAA